MHSFTIKRVAIFLLLLALMVVIIIVNSALFKIIAGVLLIGTLFLIIFLRKQGSSGNLLVIDNDHEPEMGPAREASMDGRTFSDGIESGFVILKRGDNVLTQRFSEDKETITDSEKYNNMVNEPLPVNTIGSEQLNFVLDKILTIIQPTMDAYSVVLFWHDKKLDKIVTGPFVSQSKFIPEKGKYDIQDDFLGQVFSKHVPQIRGSIPSSGEADNIRYYSQPEGIRSAVGVPFFFKEQLMGAVVIDAKVPDRFGVETVYDLGRFVSLITIVVMLFKERYSQTHSKKRLNGLLELISPLTITRNADDFIKLVTDNISSIFEWDAFAIIIADDEPDDFKVIDTLNKTLLQFGVPLNLSIEIKNTLAGTVISSGKPVIVDDLIHEERKHFSSLENITIDGSFIGVPIKYQNTVLGAVCFERLRKNAYSVFDSDYLKSIAAVIGFVMYSQVAQKELSSLGAYDQETRIFNKNMFKTLFELELEKNIILNTQSTLALIKLDDFTEQKSLFSENPVTIVMVGIVELLRAEIAPTSLIGRLSERVLVVYFFNESSNDTFLRAEKIRVKCSRMSFPGLVTRASFTVSIGVASNTGFKTIDESLRNANAALSKAIKDGGNKVANLN